MKNVFKAMGISFGFWSLMFGPAFFLTACGDDDINEDETQERTQQNVAGPKLIPLIQEVEIDGPNLYIMCIGDVGVYVMENNDAGTSGISTIKGDDNCPLVNTRNAPVGG